jgi:hypothetical protein
MQKWNLIPDLQKNAKMELARISVFYRLLLHWLQQYDAVLDLAY